LKRLLSRGYYNKLMSSNETVVRNVKKAMRMSFDSLEGHSNIIN
jgi:hypothetical protein